MEDVKGQDELGYRWHRDIDRGRILLVWKCSDCGMTLESDEDGIVECRVHGAGHVRRVEACRNCRREKPLEFTLQGWEVCVHCAVAHLESFRRGRMLTRGGKLVTTRVTVEDIREARSA